MNCNNVPVIDLARGDDCATRAAIDHACREWGFFQIRGHGIDRQVIDALYTQMRQFFAQPFPVKHAVYRSPENPWGFYDQELTKNTRDWKQIFDYAAVACGESVPRWPASMPQFRTALNDYYHACESVAQRLLHIIAANLGMAPDALDPHFAPCHSSFARLNYYPPCAEPERPDGVSTPKRGHLGVNHHTDAGAITVLLQDDQPGLEVFQRGQWRLVEPVADALVINVGDIVQVWSNDRYRAPLHRVIANADTERFSAPFFYCPSYQTDYAPLPTTVTAQRPAAYRVINWGEFYRKRAAGDYADVGEEVQITHFRI